MLTAGKFRGVVVDAECGQSKKGAPQVVVEFQLETGDHIRWYGGLVDKGRKHALKAFEALGFHGPLSAVKQLVGREADLVLEEEEWEGKKRVKVRWVNKAGGPLVSAPLPPAVQQDLDADLWGASLPGQTDGQPPHIDDDDVPF